MKSKPLPPLDFLKSRFSYDGENGSLIWKPIPVKLPAHIGWNTRHVGTRAGRTDGGGYTVILIAYNGRPVSLGLHRLIWYFETGSDPGNYEVDHINRDRSDNRFSNLRLATRAQNGRNKSTHSVHLNQPVKRPYKGVRKETTGRYIARIMYCRKTIHLGTFDTLDEAIEARREAALKYHGEFANLG